MGKITKNNLIYSWDYRLFIEQYNLIATRDGYYPYIEEDGDDENFRERFTKLGISIYEFAEVILYAEQKEILVPKYRKKYGHELFKI